ncbi:hypothetical protein V5F72_07720 [Xanthobacter flavus]|uniref:hypothetical protein n=1 Tax=Xanthobacter flavus TaxID=281 RepID=UPI0037282F88
MIDGTTINTCKVLYAIANGSGAPWWWGAVAAPAATACFGLLIAWIAIAFERRKATNQEIIKKRITIYDAMAPNLNDIYCFFLTIGRWKDITPENVISAKRDLDHHFHIYKALFSSNLDTAYNSFISNCFETFVGYGKSARLRADLKRLHSEWGTDWNPDWDSRIAPEDITTPED